MRKGINKLVKELDSPKPESKKKKKNREEEILSTVISLRKAMLKHINEPVAAIMVKEKDGKWGEWTGDFTLSSEEKRELLLSKVELFYDNNFKNGVQELGIFQKIGDEWSLYKIMNKE